MLNGALIREAREARGISQARLAESLGIREQTVWRWENRPTKTLSYQTVRGLVGELGIDERALFVHEPDLATQEAGCG